MQSNLSVREIQAPDVETILQYWLSSTPEHLLGMGVDLEKMPAAHTMRAGISEQLTLDYPEKKSYAIIWELDGRAVGHSNVNQIRFGEAAFMHLHLWQSGDRRHGIGPEFIRLTVPFFFQNLQLKRLFCEPYALNPAPNRALEKAGFQFVKRHVTVPGPMNFEQEVNRWTLEKVG